MIESAKNALGAVSDRLPINKFVRYFLSSIPVIALFFAIDNQGTKTFFVELWVFVNTYLWKILCFALAVAVVSLIWKHRNPSRKEKFKRFEDIKKNGITFGYIEFRPTCVLDSTGAPGGFAISLLNRIFDGIPISQTVSKPHWDNLISKMTKGKREYDIIATPLYDTTYRRQQVAFSKPLYYVDIGAYVRSVDWHQNGIGPFSFRQFVEQVKMRNKSLQTHVVPGEVHYSLVKKHFPKMKKFRKNSREYSINNFINRLCDTSDTEKSSIFFCERWQAEKHPKVISGEVVNILKPSQILLPVCLAMPKYENELRKYVNLQIMAIEDESKTGLHDMLIKDLGGDYTVADIDAYFNRRLKGEDITTMVDHADNLVSLDAARKK